MFVFYDIMKPKAQKFLNHRMHWDKLFNVLLTRFRYEGLPDNIPQGAIEGILLCNGTCGFTKYGGELWAIPGSYTGSYKGYLPEEYFGILPEVNPKQGKIGDKWEVIWNNLTRTPELILWQYASILSEIDVSEKCNVFYARDMKIPKVGSQEEKIQLEEAMKANRNGQIGIMVSNNAMTAKEWIDGVKEEPLLEITDVNDIDKLQYLNQYRDNIIKRFFQIYGQKTQVTSKMAQMSPDEVHANDGISLILSDEALQCRQDGLEKVNALFGTNITVDYNRCWEDEVEEMLMNNDPYDEETGEDGESDAETPVRESEQTA